MTINDWIVFCDNVRRCTAFGGQPWQKPDGYPGYIIVERDAAADAPARVTLVAANGTDIKKPVLTMMIDNEPVRGLSQTSWETTPGRYQARVKLKDSDSAELLRQLPDRKQLTLKIEGAGGDPFETPIFLADATAALLYMDGRQQRVGTVTALVKPGSEPASAVPPPPSAPRLTAHPMHFQKMAPKAAPKGVTLPDPGDCGETPPPPSVIRFSSKMSVWMACEQRGAHNETQHFWVVDAAGTRDAPFVSPGSKQDGDGTLVNPTLTEDKLVIEASDIERNCGSASGWAWTGTKFELVYDYLMPECWGIDFDDWPRIYTTHWK